MTHRTQNDGTFNLNGYLIYNALTNVLHIICGPLAPHLQFLNWTCEPKMLQVLLAKSIMNINIMLTTNNFLSNFFYALAQNVLHSFLCCWNGQIEHIYKWSVYVVANPKSTFIIIYTQYYHSVTQSVHEIAWPMPCNSYERSTLENPTLLSWTHCLSVSHSFTFIVEGNWLHIFQLLLKLPKKSPVNVCGWHLPGFCSCLAVSRSMVKYTVSPFSIFTGSVSQYLKLWKCFN